MIRDPNHPDLIEAKHAYIQSLEALRAHQSAVRAHREAKADPQDSTTRKVATRKKLEDALVIFLESLEDFRAAERRLGDVDWGTVIYAWDAPYDHLRVRTAARRPGD